MSEYTELLEGQRNQLASAVTTARSQVDVALAERDGLAVELRNTQAAVRSLLDIQGGICAERDQYKLWWESSQAMLADVLAEHTATVAALRPFLAGLDDTPTPDIGYVVCVTAEEGDALRAVMPEPAP